MLIFLYGPDTYRSTQKLQQMRDKFSKANPSEILDVVELEGDSLNEEQWHKALAVGGFWARKKLVIVRNALRVAGADILERIEADLDKIAASDSQSAIFWEDSGGFKKNPALRMSKRLKKEKFAQEFKLLDEIKAADWLVAEAQERDGEIEKMAAMRLISANGADLWALSNELDKLLAYSQGKPIDIKMTQVLVKSRLDDNIFHLVDAVLARNQAQAMKLVSYSLEQGMEPLMFMGLLTSQFRMLLILKERSLENQFLNSRAIADEFGWKPFVVQKNLGWLRQYSMERLKEIYQKLEDLDTRLKTSDGREAQMELFVADLVQ